mgnify:CR=1 FL=1
MCRSLDESWGYLNQYKQRQIQGYLWSARNLYNNMKYFVTTILRYLSTDVIAPLVTRFEEELPQYATIDAFAAGFERFLQQVYEQCFLISDRLRVSLVDTMGVCLSFVRFIKEELKDDRAFGRRKMDVVEGSVSEERSEGLRVAKSEVDARVRALEDEVRGETWRQTVEEMRRAFDEKRASFLNCMEQLPGFLQSIFLGLHRKLMQRYV